MGRRKSRLPEVIVLSGNSVRPGTEFLIGAARPHLSIVCQLLVKFFRFVRERNTANSVEIGGVSFDSVLEESLQFLCELGMSRELPTGQKDAIPTLVLPLGKA